MLRKIDAQRIKTAGSKPVSEIDRQRKQTLARQILEQTHRLTKRNETCRFVDLIYFLANEIKIFRI